MITRTILQTSILGILLSACTATVSETSELTPLVNNLGYTVEMTSPRLQPGEESTIAFSVMKDGRPADVYEVPTRVIRVSVASSNLRDFDHAFEDIIVEEKGVYSLTRAFTQADTYRIWLEIPDLASQNHHGKDSGYIGYADLTVGDGSDNADTAPEAWKVTDGSMNIELVPPANLRAGTPQQFTVRVTATDGTQFRTAMADHFYALVSPHTGLYYLEHTDHDRQQEHAFLTTPVTFDQPGTYVWWMELYLLEGTGEPLVRTLRPVFVITIP